MYWLYGGFYNTYFIKKLFQKDKPKLFNVINLIPRSQVEFNKDLIHRIYRIHNILELGTFEIICPITSTISKLELSLLNLPSTKYSYIPIELKNVGSPWHSP